jgi:hypothetical protein
MLSAIYTLNKLNKLKKVSTRTLGNCILTKTIISVKTIWISNKPIPNCSGFSFGAIYIKTKPVLEFIKQSLGH